MNDLLFDPPFWAPMTLAVIAIVLIFSGNSRLNARMKYAGVAVALLAVLYWVVGGIVKTDKEAVTARTKELTAAVDRRDWAAFEALLDPKATLLPLYLNRPGFVAGAKSTVERFDVKNINTPTIELDDKQPGLIIANIQVFASIQQTAAAGRPFRTNWRFFWVQNQGVWQCYKVEPAPGGDISDAVIQQSLTRGVK